MNGSMGSSAVSAVVTRKNDSFVRLESAGSRNLVVVRYYLDRPGYDLNNSSSRFWRDPPASTSASDVSTFLDEQNIKRKKDTKLLVEIYLDKFGSFMLLQACEENNVRFDFGACTLENPGILNIRLTDLSELLGGGGSQAGGDAPGPQRCNTSPVGLFAFSMTVGLDSLNILRKLDQGSIDPSFLLTWGPYAFFVSGLVQLLVGLNEISRNNVYGATAFLAFGAFWMANGAKLILTTYFTEGIPEVLLVPSQNKADTFLREFYICIFACVLFKQTLIMNKLTTALIGVLIVYLFAASLGGFNEAFEWMKMVLGFVLSLIGLYLFYAELTNEVYQRTVVHLYPWTSDSTTEAFGAAGRTNTLQVKAIDLRTAGHTHILQEEEEAADTNFNLQTAAHPYHVRNAAAAATTSTSRIDNGGDQQPQEQLQQQQQPANR